MRRHEVELTCRSYPDFYKYAHSIFMFHFEKHIWCLLPAMSTPEIYTVQQSFRPSRDSHFCEDFSEVGCFKKKKKRKENRKKKCPMNDLAIWNFCCFWISGYLSRSLVQHCDCECWYFTALHQKMFLFNFTLIDIRVIGSKVFSVSTDFVTAHILAEFSSNLSHGILCDLVLGIGTNMLGRLITVSNDQSSMHNQFFLANKNPGDST